MSQAELDFIRRAAPGAQRGFKEFRVPASVTLAQACLESGFGRFHIGAANNYFGIKAQGASSFGSIAIGAVQVPTKENVGGRTITVNAFFRKYKSMGDSMRDHGRFLRENSRYKPAFEHIHDAKAFARAIHKAGYATDPQYSNKLIGLMDRFNLYQYDHGHPKANGKHEVDKPKGEHKKKPKKPAKPKAKPKPERTAAETRARAFVANLQRDLNDHLIGLGSPRRLAIDGNWDPYTQAAFEQVCRTLGIEPERSVRTFRIIASTAATNAERTPAELDLARTKGAEYAERLRARFERNRGVGIARVGGRQLAAKVRAEAAIATLQRDLNAHLRRLGSPRVLAVDGTWNPFTEEAFKQVCKTLGLAPEKTVRTFRLIAGAAAVPPDAKELKAAASEGKEFAAKLEKQFESARKMRQAAVVGGKPMADKERAAAFIAGLQRDLNTQLKWLGSTRALKVDGSWDPQTERAFARVCRVLGVKPDRTVRTFRVIAGATATRTQAEMRRAKEDGNAFKAELASFFALEPAVLLTQHGKHPTPSPGTKHDGKGPRTARVFRVKSPEMKGKDVKAFQRVINERYKRWGVDTRIETDGEYGSMTRHAAREIAFGLGLAEKDYKHGFTPEVREKLRDPGRRTRAELARAERRRKWRRNLRGRPHGHGPAAALAFARAHLSTKEGPGNRGPLIDKWNQASGSPLGSAWCGNFMNACLRSAGFPNQPWLASCIQIESHARAGTGGWKWLTANPQPGDLVLYTINNAANHVGMVEKVEPTQLITIEGNTRADGEGTSAPSDQVERRHRARSLPRGYARPPYAR